MPPEWKGGGDGVNDQISLFDTLDGGNSDYDAFVEKFKSKKTTDDCYTPPLVYDAVAEWVAMEYGVDRARFVRPFYPGANFELFPYKPGDIVVDNPPFSIMSKILRHYIKKGIPFFLFGPSLTLFSSSSKEITYIPTDSDIIYENGATVKTGFVTNLDACLVRSAPSLYEAINAAMAQSLRDTKAQLPKYSYPDNVVTAAMVQRYSKHGVEYRLEKDAAVFVRSLDAQKQMGKTVFGGGFLTGNRAAADRAAADRAVAERTAAIIWELSDREREIVRKLDEKRGEGMAMKAPCKGCPDRTTGDRDVDCHTTCERYAEFLAYGAKIRKARKAFYFADGLATEGHIRLKKYPPSGANKRPWHR